MINFKNILSKYISLLGANFYRYFRPKALSMFEHMRQIETEESAKFILKNISETSIFENQIEFWRFCLDKSSKVGLFLEFGVFKGRSINEFSKYLPNIEFTGFDSFEGLNEDWKGTRYRAGFFGLGGEAPYS